MSVAYNGMVNKLFFGNESAESLEFRWLKGDLSQTSFLIACVWPMYLVLQLKNVIVGCCLEDQLIASLFKLNRKPKVDLQVSRSPAQSASIYPIRDSKGFLNVYSRFIILLIYRKILILACHYELFGREIYWLITETT